MRVLVPGRPGPVPDDRVTAYLRLLGVPRPDRPDLDALRALHRAHVEQVPWSSVETVLGWDAPTDEASCVRRVVGRRGGSGLHLNTAFGWLLEQLGYDVRRHRAGVHHRATWDAAGADGTHVALSVGLGLRGRWLVDVGLGSALREPVRLAEGPVEDGPFRFHLQRSAVLPNGWRLVHDRRVGTFVAMELDGRSTSLAQVSAGSELAAPGPVQTRELVVERRDGTGLDRLIGTRLWRIEGDRRRMRLVSTPRELGLVLTRRFNLDLLAIGLDPAALATLHERARHVVGAR